MNLIKTKRFIYYRINYIITRTILISANLIPIYLMYSSTKEKRWNINYEWTQHFCPSHVLRSRLRIYTSLEVSIKESTYSFSCVCSARNNKTCKANCFSIICCKVDGIYWIFFQVDSHRKTVHDGEIALMINFANVFPLLK